MLFRSNIGVLADEIRYADVGGVARGGDPWCETDGTLGGEQPAGTERSLPCDETSNTLQPGIPAVLSGPKKGQVSSAASHLRWQSVCSWVFSRSRADCRVLRGPISRRTPS